MKTLKNMQKKNQYDSRNKISFINNDLKFVMTIVYNENKTTHALILPKYISLYQIEDIKLHNEHTKILNSRPNFCLSLIFLKFQGCFLHHQ